MLQELTIQNFQCHRKLRIKFGSITTIVGPNDAGKSSVLRALRLALLNKPSGKQYVRHTRKRAIVELQLSNHTIQRTIGNQNTYSLDGEVFRSFRTGVPPQIAELAAVEEINFQRQHEPVFWFALTPGQTARELNKLIDLESIDRMQSAVTARIRTLKTKTEWHRTEAKQAAAKCRKLKWVNPAVRKLNWLETFAKQHDATAARQVTVAALVEMAAAAHKKAKVMAAVLSVGVESSQIGGKLEALQTRIDRLVSLISQITKLSKLSKISLPSYSQLDKQQQELTLQKQQVIRLAVLIQDTQRIEARLCHFQTELAKSESQLQAKSKNRCPQCGQIVPSR